MNMLEAKDNMVESDKLVEKCTMLKLPKVAEPRGNLSFVEGGNHIPFNIERIYYLYDVPSDSERAGHAHKELHQLFIPISGSFDIILDDGFNKKTITLNKPDKGLYVCPGIWRVLNNFSSNSVCLVLASMKYMEEDYIRDYNDFVKYAERNSKK
jgi:hypothetical protein